MDLFAALKVILRKFTSVMSGRRVIWISIGTVEMPAVSVATVPSPVISAVIVQSSVISAVTAITGNRANNLKR
ncbi:unnamed protein product [Rhizophagus irregularis]|nr:unnamed protein product [Rhizophagus irregularis]